MSVYRFKILGKSRLVQGCSKFEVKSGQTKNIASVKGLS